MRKFLPTLALLAIAATGHSRVLTDVDTPVESLFYHLRLKAPAKKNLRFSVVWNCSENDTTAIDIDIDPPTNDEFYPSLCRYRLRHNGNITASGKEEFTYTGKDTNGFSVIISADRSGADLSMGTSEPSFSIPIDFDKGFPGGIGYFTESKTEELANLLITRGAEQRRKSSFATVDSLTEYLQASDDIYEGFWDYLDRDIDTSKADIGSFYSLATVANTKGGYDIIYLGGENNYRFPWQVLEIKGELVRTPFIDNFDLIWTAADGRTLRRDTSAAFEAGHAILRLNFPLLKSSLRLRKRPSR